MPESSSTFGPLDPSPGYGPPVSSGASTRAAAGVAFEVAEVAEVAAVAVEEDVAADARPDAVADGLALLHAASAPATPRPPRIVSARRRSTRVCRSNSSP